MEKIVLVIILLLTSLFLSIGIDKPFIGHHDANNKMYRLSAINYLEKSIAVHKFGQIQQEKNRPVTQSSFYTHHPPLLPMTLAAGIALLGDHNSTIRIVPIIFSLATLFIFHKLLRLFFSARISLVALLFWIQTPMFLYFGKMADHEVPTLFFIVLAVYAFAQKRSHLAFVSVFLAQWFGWPGYYLAAILAVLLRSWALILMSLLNFVLFSAHVSLLKGSLSDLVNIFLFRTGAKDTVYNIKESYAWPAFIRQEVSWSNSFFTPAQVLLTAFAVAQTFIRRNFGTGEKVWLVFFFVAAVHVLLFKTGAGHHDYWLYYFLPFFSFGVAKCMSFLPRNKATLAVIMALLVFSILRSQPFFWALQTRIN